MTDELPPPLYVPGYFGDLPVGAYTADQMRAAILAEREACAQRVAALKVGFPSYFEIDEKIDEAVAAIRARG